MFEKKIQVYLNNIQPNHDEELNIIKMINRMYKDFDLMFDGLAIALSNSIEEEYIRQNSEVRTREWGIQTRH